MCGIVIVVILVISIGNANFAKRLMVTVDWNGAVFVMFVLLCGVRLVITQILLLSRGVLNINTRRFLVAVVVLGNQVRRRVIENLPGQVVVVCVGVASGSSAQTESTNVCMFVYVLNRILSCRR